MAKNKQSVELIEYYNISEEELYTNKYGVPSSSYAVIEMNGSYLLGYNKWRKQWEFPAGKIEPGESAIEAAKRELFEETHQKVDDLLFCGMFKIYDAMKDEYRLRAVYYGTISTIEKFIEKSDDEMTQICLWKFEDKGIYVDEVDCKMVEISIINNDKKLQSKRIL